MASTVKWMLMSQAEIEAAIEASAVKWRRENPRDPRIGWDIEPDGTRVYNVSVIPGKGGGMIYGTVEEIIDYVRAWDMGL